MCQSTYEAASEFIDNNTMTTLMGKIPVCGIVSDIKIGNLNEETTGKFTCINILNDFSGTMGEMLCIKTQGDDDEMIEKVKGFYASKGYNDDLIQVNSLQNSIRIEIREETNILKLVTGFSIICILMTVLTIVGLSSYHAKIGEKDNAVRNVFGCSKKEMIRKMTLDFTLPVLVSAVVAIPVAWAVIDRWLEGYVVRCDNSALIYAGALAVVLLVTVASVALQAFRLMRTSPAEALKKE